MEDSVQIREVSPLANRGLRWLLFAAGALLVAIGMVGIVLPLLPSTIFFILAAACFGRSSASAHRWLMTNKLFGARLRDYQERRGATVGTKVTAIGTLWLGIGLAIWLTDFQPVITVALAAIAASVSVYLLKLQTIR